MLDVVDIADRALESSRGVAPDSRLDAPRLLESLAAGRPVTEHAEP
jgi:hypothetical protein